ncbi:uncharacterized protein MONBRDRAFT_8914 [Monosiga brevicollis MX1]|uniref:alpha-L-rhamnosidase n=1 Tax=Monosiga brevicollis TaxID=81824 RepID=A9V1I1_MONBE|nr:uncharacterized protein MONBRDRAFT_8914 [Monosiga brevicollis MX1]EDQ88445.1 predicted protein [Monosiga brevicollis MX1]|eukprot:XP_001746549.1 hypothetical protein [Monosiga brevicollis MX1]
MAIFYGADRHDALRDAAKEMIEYATQARVTTERYDGAKDKRLDLHCRNFFGTGMYGAQKSFLGLDVSVVSAQPAAGARVWAVGKAMKEAEKQKMSNLLRRLAVVAEDSGVYQPGLEENFAARWKERLTATLHIANRDMLLPLALLKATSDYAWNVELNAKAGAVSECYRFHAVDPSWDESKWIGNAQLLRTEVALSAMSSTKIYISGQGAYDLYINGARVNTGSPLNAAWTYYSQRVIYDVLDVSDLVPITGTYAIGVALAPAWRDTTSFPPFVPTDCDSNERVLRMIIKSDEKTVGVTDEHWKITNDGPVQSASIYNGGLYLFDIAHPPLQRTRLLLPSAPASTEVYDATKEIDGWSSIGFDASSWSNASSIDCFQPILSARSFPIIKVQEEHKPIGINKIECPANTGSCGNYTKGTCDANTTVQVVEGLCIGKASCTIPANDAVFGDPCYDTVKYLAVQAAGCTSATPATYVVDFGENLAGVCRIQVKGNKGDSITLKHAEVLMHEPYGPADGTVYTGNLRTAQATDTYVLRGDANGETWTPSFTYHGFRYVQVTGMAVTQDTLTRVINTINYGAYRGQGSNMMSLPTDCDQRDERLGWMGDADLTAEGFALNYDSGAFMDAFVRSMIDSRDPTTGAMPDTVPWSRYGNRPADPSWSAALPQNMYVRATMGGSLDIAEAYWTELMQYFTNIDAQIPANTSAQVAGAICSSFNYLTNLRQAAELATMLNYTTDAVALANRADDISAQYTATFYDASTKCYGNCEQGALALSIMADTNYSQTLGNQLVEKIQGNGNRVTGGIIAVKALFPALEAFNQHDQANDSSPSVVGRLSMLTPCHGQTNYPSWGYMFFNDIEPATSSLWELWDSPMEGPGMNSRNHHMFSSISAWLVTEVGGLKNLDCTQQTFTLRPSFSTLLSGVEASRETACGRVSMRYQRVGGRHILQHPEGRCELDASADVWGAISRVPAASNPRVLHVEMSCSEPETYEVEVEVPAGRRAELALRQPLRVLDAATGTSPVESVSVGAGRTKLRFSA